MSRRPAFVLILVTQLLACTSSWRESESFRGELECGQTFNQVSEIAKRYGIDEVKFQGSSATKAFFQTGETWFYLYFDAAGLESYSEIRGCGFKCAQSSIRPHLCTGVITGYPSIQIDAPCELEFAEVFLDEIKKGHLSQRCSTIATRWFGVRSMPLGVHDLVIRKEGYEEIRYSFDYSPEDYWPEIDHFKFVVEKSDLVRSSQ